MIGGWAWVLIGRGEKDRAGGWLFPDREEVVLPRVAFAEQGLPLAQSWWDPLELGYLLIIKLLEQ